MIDYALDNRLFVLADGRDLLAHFGDSEAPAWRFELPAPAVVIGQTSLHVITATADGAVFWFDRDTGALVGRMHAGLPLVAGASDREGRVVVLAADGRLIAVNAGLTHMTVLAALKGANNVALADDGRVLIATPGYLTELDPAGRTIGQARSSPVNALASHPSGVWFVAGGWSIQRYKSGRLSLLGNLPRDQTATHLAAGAAGVGVGAGAHFWLLDHARPAVVTINVTYASRLITGISFGPQPWVALSLAGGDANKIDYNTSVTHRSDTHPGRTHNRWVLVIRKGKGR